MNETIRGRVHKFGDYVECDSHIVPFRAVPDYVSAAEHPEKLAQVCFTPVDPEFPKRVRKGDFIVAGKGFGSGKTHELGMIAIEVSGIKAIIAESIQRTYFRNAVNHGIYPIICPGISAAAETGDLLEVEPGTGKITNLTRNRVLRAIPLPELVLEIVRGGGILPLVKKRLDAAKKQENH
ncbi:MAG: 3-isopropylmalate dehydratase [Chloroflexi bacterium]|nr:3-isopropylmalate dehydratase [Chloroflexota bacterium]